MVVGKTFPEMEKFLPILIKPLYFVSCIMFPLHAVPRELLALISSGTLSCISLNLSRECVVAGYESQG